MSSDLTCYNATMPDTSGPVATGRDTSYSLSIDDAGALYARAGHPRTPRSIQRYCASHHLDCVKETTTLGDKYFVNADSVARHIAQIEELIELDNRASGRVRSRHDATLVASHFGAESGKRDDDPVSPHVAAEPAEIGSRAAHADARQPATPDLQSRHVATGQGGEVAYVAQLEKRIDEKDQFISLLTTQLNAKDQQITDLSARYRETHTLLGAMQRMLAPLLGQADPYHAPPERRDTEQTPSS